MSHITVHNHMLEVRLGGLFHGRVTRSAPRRGAACDDGMQPATPEQAAQTIIEYLAEQERLTRIHHNEWSTIVSRGGTPAYCWACGKLEDAAMMVNLDGIMHASGFVCEDCLLHDEDFYGDPSDEHEENELARIYVAAFRHLRKRGAQFGPENPGFRDRFWINAQNMADAAAHTLDEDWSSLKKDRREQILRPMGLEWTGEAWVEAAALR